MRIVNSLLRPEKVISFCFENTFRGILQKNRIKNILFIKFESLSMCMQLLIGSEPDITENRITIRIYKLISYKNSVELPVE